MSTLRHLYNVYITNKIKKVGELCKCPSCGSAFTKTNYQQAFCKTYPGTECKDYYWNNVTPQKRNNTTRISPANAAYKKKIDELRDMGTGGDGWDDQSWDAHKLD